MPMLEQVRRTLERYAMLQPGDRVLVAVSGGVDSVVLLQVLLELHDELQLELGVAHFDHRLRPDSAEDARFVAELARRWGLPFWLGRRDVAAHARRRGLSLEAAARELRYAFLERTAQRQRCTKLALGHQLNDQVETVLMRLLRGAGLEGLRGMPAVRPAARAPGVWLIRPLIACPRAAVEAFARARKLEYREDPTNRLTDFLRNRVRWELLPLLQRYNPRVLEAIARAREAAEEASAYLLGVAAQALDACTLEARTNRLVLDRAKLLGQPPLVQKVALRQGLRRLRESFVGFEHLQAIAEAARGPRMRWALELPGGLRVERRGERLVLAPIQARPAPLVVEEHPLAIGGTTFCEALGWGFSVEARPYSPLEKPVPARLEVWVDRATIGEPLVVRNRRPGDRFVPLGMRGHKKLQDFFVDAKVPRELRDRVPLVCDAQGIVWVVGFRLADPYKITERTREILKIRAWKLEDEPAP